MTQKLYDQLIDSPRGMTAATMRDVILPLILGKETNGILYWIGKDLARQYPVQSIENLTTLVGQLGLGNLALASNRGTTFTWKLSGPVVAERISLQKEHTSFTLEAGLIAKELEYQLGRVTEASVLEMKKDSVTIVAEADTEPGEVELVTFIQPRGAEDTSGKKRRLTRAEKKAAKQAAKAEKKKAKLAAKAAKKHGKHAAPAQEEAAAPANEPAPSDAPTGEDE